MRHERRGFLRILSAVSMWPLVAPHRIHDPRTRVIGEVVQPAALSTISAWRSRFPALAQEISGHRLAYLDNAATTLRPREVIDALVRFYERDNANPSASLHTLARRAAEAQDAARTRVARFLNAASSEEVIFTRGTTEAINFYNTTDELDRLVEVQGAVRSSPSRAV